jgi:hypothetical protein
MWPEAFLGAFRLGCLRPDLLYTFREVCVCFLTVYSFDTVPLIFVFIKAFIEEFTSVYSLSFVLQKLH